MLKTKNYEKKYFKSCLDLVENTWHFDRIFSSGVSELFFRKKLHDSAYRKVIIKDNQVIGLFFATDEKMSPLKRIRQKIAFLNDEMWFKAKKKDFSDYLEAKDFKESYKKIDQLIEINKENFDSEIALFIVSSEFQGQGLGKSLLNQYFKYCKKNSFKNLILWTDYDCNLEFYPKAGFTLYGTFTSDKLMKKSEKAPNGFIYTFEVK